MLSKLLSARLAFSLAACMCVSSCGGGGGNKNTTTNPDNQNPVDTTPPVVSISASATSFTANGDLTLTATATDNKGIAHVDFYDGTNLVAILATAAPYTDKITITSAKNGSHSYTAKAYDDAGNVTTSTAVTVDINIPVTSDTTPPTVSLSASSSNITAAGNLTLTATAADDVSVAKVEFYDGTTLLNTATTSPFNYSVALTNANNGTKNYTAKAYDAAGNATTSTAVSVTINIATPDTQAPVVSLSASSTSVTAAGDVTLTATATDNVGVVKVEFYDGATLLTSSTTSPYTFKVSVTAANNGTKSFTAKAYDAAGNVTASSAVNVTVNIAGTGDTTAPIVSLASSSANVTAASSITLTATATDNIGVTKVEFYDGTTLLNTDTASPFSFAVALTSANNGTKTYTAKAYDAAGNSTLSAPVSVTINIDTTAPTVSLTASSNSITLAGNLSLSATASDNVGVTKVEFYDGATLINTDASSPFAYTVALTSANNGTKSYTAKAYDAAGNSTVSAPVGVTVNIDSTAPTISLAASASSITVAGNLTLTATAADNVGVAKVEFYDGTTLLNTDTTSPFSFSVALTGANNGTKNYTAKAYDAAGNSQQSSAVSVTVNIDATLPTVSLAANTTNFTASGSLVLTATATDDVGITKVDFYQGTTLLNSVTSAPYRYLEAFGAVNNGTKTYTAKAYDGAGNVATSSVVTVVVNIDGIAPTVSLTSSSTNVTAAGNITLTAPATDNIGVVKVEFYDGATLVGTDTTSPYTLAIPLTSDQNGTKSYTAKAYDTAGNIATSSAVSVTINIPDLTRPTITSVTPANSAIEVLPDAAIDVVFSEPMDISANTKVNLKLTNAGTAVGLYPIVWASDHKSLHVLPSSPLTKEKSFTITIVGSDPAGNTLAGTTTFSFTTVPNYSGYYLTAYEFPSSSGSPGTDARLVSYDPSFSGTVTPIRVLKGNNTKLQSPNGLAVDKKGNLFVASSFNSKILKFKAWDNGDVAPRDSIEGSNTGLVYPTAMAIGLDQYNNEIELFVVDTGAKAILVFDINASGNVAPIRKISGTTSGLTFPRCLSLYGGEIFVDSNGAIRVFGQTDNGDVAPRRIISAPASGSADYTSPDDIKVDSNGIFIVQYRSGSIYVVPRASNGAVAPTRTINPPWDTSNRSSGALLLNTSSNTFFIASHGAINAFSNLSGANGSITANSTMTDVGNLPSGGLGFINVQ